MFGNLFGQDFIGMFVTLVFLISIDFWVVKNITGRLLAGLRWWNYIDDDGNSHWVFENRLNAQQNQNIPGSSNDSNSTVPLDPAFAKFSQENDPNNFQSSAGSDSTVFWMGLFIPPILWFMFLFSSIFSFNVHWVLFIVMALVMSGSNLYGYVRCRFGKNYNYGSVISQYVGPKMLFNVSFTYALSSFFLYSNFIISYYTIVFISFYYSS